MSSGCLPRIAAASSRDMWRLAECCRLHETGGIRGTYIALSHCWGQGEALTTTTATIEQRYAGFTEAELPKTYQDAVTIAGKLGIRYIGLTPYA
jgi:hypothetical protein